MRVASVCSSVGGLDLGLHRAGHQTVFLCEVDAWRRTVLNRHWPGVPVHPDLKELTADDIPECDLFVGGTPCQDLSVAGRRAGLDGERSGLFHAFAQLRLDLYERHGCAWSLWENVAGALSSNDGRDFATVLASHVGADVAVPAGGWASSGFVVGPWGTAEWRLLDAQYFGVPQRRRRVFVVGHLGADSPVEVLADTPRRGWHSPASGEARPGAAAGPPGGADGSRVFSIHPDAIGRDGVSRTAGPDAEGRVRRRDAGLGIQEGLSYTLTTGAPPAVAGSLTARYGKGVDSDVSDGQVVVSHTLTANGFDASEDGTGRGTPMVAAVTVAGTMPARGKTGGYDVDPSMAADGYLVAATLTSGSHNGRPPGRRQEDDYNVVAFHVTQDPISGDVSPALGTSSTGMGVAVPDSTHGVRRLSPTECERLMAWPDGWTLDEGPSLLDAQQGWPGGPMPHDPQPDGRRYSACGDGVVAHVAEWIGLGFPVAA